MAQTQTPSIEQTEFDRLTAPIGEFEYLPVHPSPPYEFDPELEAQREEHELDARILSGLVSPV
jgi:hypothetical protein